MEYGKIISTGWSQAWKHKTLWIFGFLISGGGGGNISNFSDHLDKFGLGQRDLYHIKQFFVEHMEIIAIIAFLAFIAFLIWIILSTISGGALIHAAGQFKKNEEYRFTKSFGVGVSFFWRLLGLGLLTFVVIMAIVIIMALVGVLAFMAHVGLGVVSLIFMIPIFIICLFVILSTAILGERYIVLEDRPVFDSIGDGFNLWKANLGPTVLYTLVYIGIGIAVGLGTLVILLFTVVPFVAIGFINWVVAILIGIPIVLLILLVLEGFSGSAMNLMTTEFYFQLRGLGSPAAAQPAVSGGSQMPPPPPPAPAP